MKNMASFLLILGVAMLAFGCQHNKEKQMEADTIEVPVADNQVMVTKVQFEASGMELGQPTLALFPDAIKASGYIDVPPRSKAAVSVYYGGYVKGLDLLPGQWVKKGQLLFSLENPDFVQMQQDYLETSAQLTFLQSDFERQKTLAAENIASQKNYLKAESDYQVHQARSTGLKKKLELLGINLEKVRAGDFTIRVNVYAPISGFITQVNTNSGNFLNTSDMAVEITNADHLHVELEIFEKDINQLRKGQVIKFWLPGASDKPYTAEVYLIGSVVEGENRIVRVHGHLVAESVAHQLIPGMYVEALVQTVSDSVMALPEEAVVAIGEQAYILVQNNVSSDGYFFEKQLIRPGRSINGMVELKDAETWPGPILIKGAFNLIAGE